MKVLLLQSLIMLSFSLHLAENELLIKLELIKFHSILNAIKRYSKILIPLMRIQKGVKKKLIYYFFKYILYTR